MVPQTARHELATRLEAGQRRRVRTVAALAARAGDCPRTGPEQVVRLTPALTQPPPA